MKEETKLKRGQKPENWKENCEKFPEYYKKNNPEWSDEQCKDAAKKFNKTHNWQCIEYYIRKYPGKTLEECEVIRKEAIASKNKNHPFSIEYYRERFPNASEKELNEMLSAHAKKNNFQSIEYYRERFPNASEKELNEMLINAKKDYLAKRPDNSGEKNPGHKSKTTELERRQRSPKCIEFYELRYPGHTHEEYKQMVKDHKKFTATQLTPEKHSTKLEYWLSKGYTEDEAKYQLSKRQRTFSKQKCIEKYGEEIGQEVFNNRQEKWMKSFKNTRNNNIKNGIQSSNIADEFFNKLESLMPGGARETLSGRYSFDYIHDNKIIEFNGDYWHMNPKIYKKDEINKTTGHTAQAVWKKDNEKRKYAISRGYEYYVVWENEYRNDPDLIIKECVEYLKS